MKTKKILTLALACVMALALAVPAFATNTATATGTGAESAVNATITATTFSVTVPTTILISRSENGTITVPDDLKITNNCSGQIYVSSVAVQTATGTYANDWTNVAYTTDFAALPVDSTKYALTINDGDIATGDGLTTIATSLTPINANASADLTLAAKLPASSSTITNTPIGHIVFTVAWYTGA